MLCYVFFCFVLVVYLFCLRCFCFVSSSFLFLKMFCFVCLFVCLFVCFCLFFWFRGFGRWIHGFAAILFVLGAVGFVGLEFGQTKQSHKPAGTWCRTVVFGVCLVFAW